MVEIHDALQVLVGLGNPGTEYQWTRHNLGFYVLDAWVSHYGGSWCNDSKFNALVATVQVGTQKIFCLKPQTFMNASGRAVSAFCNYYRIPSSHVCVLCDDISIPFGGWKMSIAPGTARHNGVKSVLECMGAGFVRYRMGLGHRPKEMCLGDYVLATFSLDEQKQLPLIAAEFERNMEVFIDKGVLKGLNCLKRVKK